MDHWNGRETADITYDDANGHFTSLLAHHGYLDWDTWRNSRPKYYIEVKTTTGPCDTPFYMSKHQYEWASLILLSRGISANLSQMQSIHNRDDHSEVYMILRVFDVLSEEIRMRVYLDPEKLRLNEDLIFTGETWSVVPG